jgi:hypothetical protein
MSTTKIPGFTAEASLQRSIGQYRAISQSTFVPMIIPQENCRYIEEGTRRVCRDVPDTCTIQTNQVDVPPYCLTWSCPAPGKPIKFTNPVKVVYLN